MVSGHLGTRRAVVAPCGTEAAARRHYRHGGKPCQACKDAQNLAARERAQARGALPGARYGATAPRDASGRWTAGSAA